MAAGLSRARLRGEAWAFFLVGAAIETALSIAGYAWSPFASGMIRVPATKGRRVTTNRTTMMTTTSPGRAST